ncbi:MAG TPA: DUF5677 domain-containing protein [Longimicrobium sp.]|nr:DUF5677 domain-containing protein [Longimicrobium sp.]
MQELLVNTVKVFALGRDLLLDQLRQLRTEDEELSRYVQSLLVLLGDRSQSAMILIGNGRTWEAEILMRSSMEATIKILFVCFATPSRRSERISEFWNDLAEINKLRQSERARTLAGQVRVKPNPHGEEVVRRVSPIILPRKVEKELAEKWKDRRNAVENKWAIHRMLKDIQDYMAASFELAVMESMLHSYGLTSDLIHCSETAIWLRADRQARPEPERQLLETAHAARLLSDSLSYLGLIMRGFSHAGSVPSRTWPPYFSASERIEAEIDGHSRAFWQTQEQGAS